MAAPITWRTVAAPDLSSSARVIGDAGRSLGDAFRGIGDAVKTGAEDYSNWQTDQFISDLNNAPDDATRQAMIQEASKAFLNMNRVNEAQRAAELHDQARAQFNQSVEKYEYDVSRRGFNEKKAQTELDHAINRDKRQGIQTGLVVKADGRAQTLFDNKIADRNENKQAQKLVSEGILAARNIGDPAQRFGRLQQIITDAAAGNVRLSQQDQATISREVNAAAERMPANSVIDISKYSRAFSQLSFDMDSQGNAGNRQMTSAELSTFRTNVKKQIQADNPFLSAANVDRLLGETLAQIPGFSAQARVAGMNTQTQAGADKSSVTEAIGIAEWNNQLEAAEGKAGVLNVVKKFLRKSDSVDFSTDTISDQDLNKDINDAMAGLEAMYPNKLSPKDKGKILMSIMGSSHVDEAALGWWSDTQFVTPDGTYDWDALDTNQSAQQAFKAAFSQYLPN